MASAVGTVESLIGQYLPAEAAARRFEKAQAALALAGDKAELSQAQQVDILRQMHEELAGVTDTTEDELTAQRELWDELADGINDSMRETFADLVADGRASLDDLGDYMLRWLARMAYDFATNPLQVAVGASGGGGQLLGGGGITGTPDTSVFGGGGFGGVGQLFGGSQIGAGIAGTAARFGVGTGGGFWTQAGTNLINTPNWAFGAGGLGGSLLGNALFDGGYSGIGSGLGSAAGSVAGGALAGQLAIPIPGVGAVLGGLLGGTGGGFLGSLFGGGGGDPRIRVGGSDADFSLLGADNVPSGSHAQFQAAISEFNASLDALEQQLGPAAAQARDLRDDWARGQNLSPDQLQQWLSDVYSDIQAEMIAAAEPEIARREQELAEREQERMRREQAIAQRAELENQLLRLTDAEAALAQERDAQLEQLEPGSRALQERIWALQDEQAAAENAARAAEDRAAVERRIADERAALELRLLELADPDAALAAQREQELAALDESNRALQERIWALQDAAEAERQAQEARESALEDAAEAERQAQEARESALQDAEAAISAVVSAEDALTQIRVQGVREQADAQTQALREQTDAQVQALREQADAQAQAASQLGSLSSEWQSLADSIAGWLARLRNDVDPAAAYTDTLRRARGGDREAIEALPSAADAQLAQLQAQSRTATEFARARAGVLADVGLVGRDAQGQADLYLEQQAAIEAEVQRLNEQADGLRVSAEAQIAQIQASAEAQIEALETAGEDRAAEAEAALAQSRAEAEAAVQHYLGTVGSIQSAASSITSAISALDLSVELPGDGFARGGIASGPSSGYPVTLHGTEAVIPLDGGSVPVRVDDAGMVAELAALRAEVAALRSEQQRQHHASLREQQHAADVLERWEAIGQPAERA